MRIGELALVLFLAATVAAAALAIWHDRQRKAQLGLDLARVQELAGQYAAVRCAGPPPLPTALADVLAELGAGTAGVSEPARWSIVVAARPDRMGVAAAVRYTATADSWQAAWLLSRRNATRFPGGVELPVGNRRRAAPNQSGFQLLLENRSC